MIDILHEKKKSLIIFSLLWTFLVPLVLVFSGLNRLEYLVFLSAVPFSITVLANTYQIRYRLYDYRDPYVYMSGVVVAVNLFLLLYDLSVSIKVLMVPLFILLSWFIWYYLLRKFDPFFVQLPFLAIPFLPGWLIIDFDLAFSFALALSLIVAVHTFFISNRDATEKINVVILTFVIWAFLFALAFSFS